MKAHAPLLCVVVALGLIGGAEGHGSIREPISRVHACLAGGKNKRCTVGTDLNVQQSSVYPKNGPRYGNIASAGMAEYRILDEQSTTRWWRNPMQSGDFTFQWWFEAPHPARIFKYFITREGWNPNNPLTVDQFEAKPFCSIDGQKKRPPQPSYHRCTIPQRRGYHVILSIWDVSNTGRAFYNVIDCDFGGRGGGGRGRTAFPLPPLQNYNNWTKGPRNRRNPWYGKGLYRNGAPPGGIGMNLHPNPMPPPEPQCAAIIPLGENCYGAPYCCADDGKCKFKNDQTRARCIRRKASRRRKAV